MYGGYGNNPYIPQPVIDNMQPMREEAKRVNGRNGAEMYRMAPNSSAVLLDENNPMIWFLQTDGAGYKTITPYDITKHVDEPEKNENHEEIMKALTELDRRVGAIEEALK